MSKKGFTLSGANFDRIGRHSMRRQLRRGGNRFGIPNHLEPYLTVDFLQFKLLP